MLMDHNCKNSHHGDMAKELLIISLGMALVGLGPALGKLGLIIEGVLSEVKSFVTEVTGDFTRLDTVEFKSSNEGNNNITGS